MNYISKSLSHKQRRNAESIASMRQNTDAIRSFICPMRSQSSKAITSFIAE